MTNAAFAELVRRGAAAAPDGEAPKQPAAPSVGAERVVPAVARGGPVQGPVPPARAHKVDASFGSFEKHTKGFGLKYLQKFNFQFGGLGKAQQGIANPIQVKVRPKDQGIGFGSESMHTARDRAAQAAVLHGSPPPADAAAVDEREARNWRADKSGGGRRGGGRRRAERGRAVYKTAAEIIAAESEAGGDALPPGGARARGRVIDMRGPAVIESPNLAQLVAGADAAVPVRASAALAAAAAAAEGPRIGRELVHNLRTLVEMTEVDLVKSTRRRVGDAKTEETARAAAGAATARADEARMDAVRLRELAARVAAVGAAAGENEGFGLDDAGDAVGGLREGWPEEFVAQALWRLAPALVQVVLRRAGAWEPLDEDAMGALAAAAASCRRSLEEPPGTASAMATVAAEACATRALPAVDALLRGYLLPRARAALGGAGWSPVDGGASARHCVRALAEVLPADAVDELLESCVSRRLADAIAAWAPSPNAVPLHAWLLPWVPLLGAARANSLWPDVRVKLGYMLAAWTPGADEARVRAALAPWRDVFDAAAYNALVVRGVLPKLAAAVRAVEINPARQELGVLQAVLSWDALVPQFYMAAVVLGELLPRWLGVLREWLTMPGVNLAHVAVWYAGWRRELPRRLQRDEGVVEVLWRSLELIRAAAAGAALPALPGPGAAGGAGSYDAVVAAYSTRRGAEAAPGGTRVSARLPASLAAEAAAAASRAARLAGAAAGEAELPFRDVVAALAERAGVSLVPNAARPTVDGQACFVLSSDSGRAGPRVVCYVNGSVLFVEEGSAFRPLAVATALERAARGAS